jgi:glycosyltransferase involved in cell wall biosynthesis
VTGIFDWTLHKSAKLQNLILRKFEEYFLRDKEDINRKYGIICLLQVRNESSHLPDVLLHLEGICDGIILLDDGSDDGSYTKAASEKLLLKARKTYTGIFNDLENRNLLLQLAYLFRAEWFFFMDADERLDLRYSDLRSITRMEEVDTVSFRVVHLWNREDRYRKDLPEGKNGILRRFRMFRNKGFLQIGAGRALHFCVTPFRRNILRSSVLILHYGLLNPALRENKKIAYMLQDPDGSHQGYTYDYLSDGKPDLGSLEEI